MYVGELPARPSSNERYDIGRNGSFSPEALEHWRSTLRWPTNSTNSNDSEHQCDVYYQRDAAEKKSTMLWAQNRCARSQNGSYLGDEFMMDCVARMVYMAMVCDTCKSSPDFYNANNLYMSRASVVTARVYRMAPADSCMLVAAFVIVSFYVAASMRNIFAAEMTRRAALPTRSTTGWCARKNCRSVIPDGWHLGLLLILFLRLCVFLPMAIMAVPLGVLFRGSNAVDIAMDTLAVLFLLEFDQLIFDHAMSLDVHLFVEKCGESHGGLAGLVQRCYHR